MFDQDFMMQKVYVRGEVSNCKYHTSGHIYFTLKDETGTLNAVMFAGNAMSLKFRLKEGQSIICLGSISIYEKSGSYQLYAKSIELDGAGELYQRFEALKNELEEMGMFAPEYKRAIPKYVKTVGIVTAPTGAAIQDMINISHRRNPYVQLILYPALVQGEAAANSIVRGIEELTKLNPDVIIIGRGGGSIEDLWAFNERIVAEAIFACPIPIISAVGHQTDFTIADYVSDLRAPTPSAAAELAVFDYEEFHSNLLSMKHALTIGLENNLKKCRNQLLQYQVSLQKASPKNRILQQRHEILNLEDALENEMKRKIEGTRNQLMILATRMEELSPLKKLTEGYSITEASGKVLTSVKQVQCDEEVMIHIIDGDVKATVKEVREIAR